MSREVPYEEETKCDKCGRTGAYDFMGDFLCGRCIYDNEDELDIGEEEDEK